jgi:hypothetical protein
MSKKPLRPPQVNRLFEFLFRNRAINQSIQRGFVAEALSPETVEDRAILLMQHVLNTQSSPKLDHILQFLKAAAQSNCLARCADFRQWAIGRYGGASLWEALNSAPGWGPKTAALFVRNLAIVGMSPSLAHKFWPDIDVMTRGEVQLPVDAVIIAIFERVSAGIGRHLTDYSRINAFLSCELGYSSEEMFVWDDLWFWGFITQRSVKLQKTRRFEWNEAKYWSIPHAPKHTEEIAHIHAFASEFLSLVN